MAGEIHQFTQSHADDMEPARSDLWWHMIILAVVVGAGVVAYYSTSLLTRLSQAGTAKTSLVPAHCVIKGNVSAETGERTFHLPDQKYYASIRISPPYDERWFCTAAEARVAGWRKAKR